MFGKVSRHLPGGTETRRISGMSAGVSVEISAEHLPATQFHGNRHLILGTVTGDGSHEWDSSDHNTKPVGRTGLYAVENRNTYLASAGIEPQFSGRSARSVGTKLSQFLLSEWRHSVSKCHFVALMLHSTQGLTDVQNKIARHFLRKKELIIN